MSREEERVRRGGRGRSRGESDGKGGEDKENIRSIKKKNDAVM